MTSDSSIRIDEIENRLRNGDAQALAELFVHQRERLWRVIHFRLAEPLRGRLEPDDVLQEAFLSATRRLKHYAASPATSPFIWLRMIVNQTLIDLHRQHLGVQKRDAAREVSIDDTAYVQATSASVVIQLAVRPRGRMCLVWSRMRLNKWTRLIAKCWHSDISRN